MIATLLELLRLLLLTGSLLFSIYFLNYLLDEELLWSWNPLSSTCTSCKRKTKVTFAYNKNRLCGKCISKAIATDFPEGVYCEELEGVHIPCTK